MRSPVQVRIAAALACAVVWAGPATPAARGASAGPGADGPASPDVSALTLEELLDLEVVEGAARYAQRRAEVAASVTIVSATEIRDHGWQSFADVLRSVRGVQVSDDRNYTYAGVRGFALPGDYGTRLLVLIDGVRINDNLYSGALFGEEFPLDLENVERVEIIRGPASSLYGTNAMLGVVNVVTRKGVNARGAEVAASGGSFGTGRAFAAWGQRGRGGLDAVLSASLLGIRGRDLRFDDIGVETSSRLDRERGGRLFGRLERGDWRLVGGWSHRTKHVPTASFGSVPGDERLRTLDEYGWLDVRWRRPLRTGVEVRAHLGLSHYHYEGVYPYGEGDLASADDSTGQWWGGDAVLTLETIARHKLSLGVEYRDNFRQEQRYTDFGAPELSFDDRSSSRIWAAFAQDEVRLGADVRLVAGLRYDHDASFGGHLSPRLAALVSAGAATTVKLLYGRAFRAPNAYELGYYAAQGPLEPESMETFEAVVERRLGAHWFASASSYGFTLDDLIAFESAADERLRFANRDRASSRGVELEVEARWPKGVEGRASWSLGRARDDRTDERLVNSPTHVARLGLTVPLRGERWRAGLEVEAMSGRPTPSGGRVAGHAICNLSLAARRLLGPLDFNLTVFNLLDADYAVAGSEEHLQDSLPQDGRSLRLRAGWRF